jgi:hypothetical protein
MSSLVLPVPEVVMSLYLVPGDLQTDQVAAIARDQAPRLLSPPLPDVMNDQLNGPLLTTAVFDADEQPLPLEILKSFGAEPEQLDAVARATHFIGIRVLGQPGWPPLADWSARAVAACVATALEAPLIDLFDPRIHAAEAALRSLPDDSGQVRLSAWVQVRYSGDTTGQRMTTSGLGRFGLPELQTVDVPPNLARPWGEALTGLASMLVGAWSERLRERSDEAPVELPATLTLTARHVARAYGAETDLDGTTTVRLELEPGTKSGDSFLNVLPPLDHPTSAGEFVEGACAALFGA